jgi:hypothetical protein
MNKYQVQFRDKTTMLVEAAAITIKNDFGGEFITLGDSVKIIAVFPKDAVNSVILEGAIK